MKRREAAVSRLAFQLLVQERMVILRPALPGRALQQSRTSAQVVMEELHAILQRSLSCRTMEGRDRLESKKASVCR